MQVGTKNKLHGIVTHGLRWHFWVINGTDNTALTGRLAVVGNVSIKTFESCHARHNARATASCNPRAAKTSCVSSGFNPRACLSRYYRHATENTRSPCKLDSGLWGRLHRSVQGESRLPHRPCQVGSVFSLCIPQLKERSNRVSSEHSPNSDCVFCDGF